MNSKYFFKVSIIKTKHNLTIRHIHVNMYIYIHTLIYLCICICIPKYFKTDPIIVTKFYKCK